MTQNIGNTKPNITIKNIKQFKIDIISIANTNLLVEKFSKENKNEI